MYVHAKTKWLWPVVLVFLLLLIFVLRSGGSRPDQVSARFVRRSTDSNGLAHIFYEVTNRTRNAIGMSVSSLQANHERTGWWDVRGMWTAVWHVEKSAGNVQNAFRPTLYARSSARLEIVQPLFWKEGSAVSGKVWHCKIENGVLTYLRSFASRLGLPVQRLMLPKPDSIELPEVILSGNAQVVLPPAGAAMVAQQTSSPLTALRPSEQVLPAGSILFESAPLRSVLDIYAELADAHLKIDPRVRVSSAEISLQLTQSMTRSDVLLLFERTLMQQAGLTMRHLQSNSVEVMPSDKASTKSSR
jgi:hypothetical protein